MEQSDLDYVVDVAMSTYYKIFVNTVLGEHTSLALADDVFDIMRDTLANDYKNVLLDNFTEQDIAEIANYQRKYFNKMVSLGDRFGSSVGDLVASEDFQSKLELVYKRHNIE